MRQGSKRQQQEAWRLILSGKPYLGVTYKDGGLARGTSPEDGRKRQRALEGGTTLIRVSWLLTNASRREGAQGKGSLRHKNLYEAKLILNLPVAGKGPERTVMSGKRKWYPKGRNFEVSGEPFSGGES